MSEAISPGDFELHLVLRKTHKLYFLGKQILDSFNPTQSHLNKPATFEPAACALHTHPNTLLSRDMPGPWNDATDKQLLLGIIHLTAPQLPKWDQVAALMGDGFTAESVRYAILCFPLVDQAHTITQSAFCQVAQRVQG